MADNKDSTESEFNPEIYEFELIRHKPEYIQKRYLDNRFRLSLELSKKEQKPISKTKSLMDKALSLAEDNIPVSENDIKDLHNEIYFDNQKKLLNKMEKSREESNWVAGIEKSQPRGDRE